MGKGATNEDVESQVKIGDCYYNGKGVEQDYTKAVYWYNLAALQNSDVAQYKLGICYLNGIGVEQNQEEGVRLLKKSDIPQADSALAIVKEYAVASSVDVNQYLASSIDIEDDRIAVKDESDNREAWLLKAAEEGCADAQYELALKYQNAGDDEEADTWLHKSANQGFAIAQNELGDMHWDENNYEMAVEWYRKAAEQG